MKVVVDKLPKNPHECLFAKMVESEYYCTLKSYDGALCFTENCEFLKEERISVSDFRIGVNNIFGSLGEI